MTQTQLNLDVDAPDQVSAVLRNAAQAYYESQGDLQSAWQDSKAGSDWSVIAKILERAAKQIDDKITVYLRDSRSNIPNINSQCAVEGCAPTEA